MLLRLLVELSEDETVPALDQAAESGLASLLVGVCEDQTQCRGFGDGSKSSEEVTGLEEKK